MQNTLVDASALIALFDDNDKHHGHYAQVFADLGAARAKLYTTWPCLTEASYFLAPRNHFALLDWLEAGGAHVYPLERYHLKDLIAAMQQYGEAHKLQMDLADASLYFAASELKTTLVLTLDRRDFGRYVLPNRRQFEII